MVSYLNEHGLEETRQRIAGPGVVFGRKSYKNKGSANN